MKRITTQKKITMRKFLLLVLLLAVSSLHGFAQGSSEEPSQDPPEMFTYADEGKTIIDGLTTAGRAATTLTIPATVTKVNSGAFYYALQGNTSLSSLVIEDGGNPLFESNLFDRTHTLTSIETGNGMSEARIYALLASLGSAGSLDKVFIKAYTESDGVNWLTDEIKAVLTSGVSVTLPAALVSDQVFGDAVVCGRFTLEKSLVTFSGNVRFEDTDQGSNMLFYVATEVNGNQIHVKRVDYIREREGVLIHNATNTSVYADLPRNSGTTTKDDERYAANKFVGMPDGGPIYATETIGNVEYTNFILSNGQFIPTQTGTLRANRAFLRITTEQWEDIKKNTANSKVVGFVFDDDETAGINAIENGQLTIDNEAPMYNLAGQKVSKNYKGIVIQNGKKYVVR